MMTDKSEVTKIQPTNEGFLTKRQDIDSLPSAFSFNNPENQFGLSALTKWSTALQGKETAGVMYIDEANQLRFQHLTAGEHGLVPIAIFDLTQPDIRTEKEVLKGVLQYRKEMCFVLTPPGYQDNTKIATSNIEIKIDNKVQNPIEVGLLEHSKVIHKTGLGISGSIHTHKASPPNGHDFVRLLYQDNARDIMKGVIGGDTLYLMVTSTSTSIHPTDIDAMNKLGDEIDQASEVLKKSGVSTHDALLLTLTKHCHDNNIALYTGDIKENVFNRMC